MKRSLALLILLAFLGGCCSSSCGAVHRPRLEFPLPPTDQRVQTSWTQALTQSKSPTCWHHIPPVIVMRGVVLDTDGARILGRYISYVEVDSVGNFVNTEQVLVYLLPHEDGDIRTVLFHEFLHAIWNRRCISEPGFRVQNPDSEVWVCQNHGCPEQESQQSPPKALSLPPGGFRP